MKARLSVHEAGQSRPTPAAALQVPKEIEDALEPAKDNDEETKRIGIELGTKMCRRLLDAGAPGLHMYTLNLERSALAILENLGLIKGRVRLCAGILHDLSRPCCLFRLGKAQAMQPAIATGKCAKRLMTQERVERTESLDVDASCNLAAVLLASASDNAVSAW